MSSKGRRGRVLLGSSCCRKVWLLIDKSLGWWWGSCGITVYWFIVQCGWYFASSNVQSLYCVRNNCDSVWRMQSWSRKSGVEFIEWPTRPGVQPTTNIRNYGLACQPKTVTNPSTWITPQVNNALNDAYHGNVLLFNRQAHIYAQTLGSNSQVRQSNSSSRCI